MTSAPLALTPSFHSACLSLSATHVKAVLEAIDKLQRGLGATHLHALKGLPFKSFGVNRDALRIICQQEGDTLLLLHVGPHDKAYAWARRHRVIQVGHIIRLVETERVAQQDLFEEAVEAPPGPLAAVPAKWFRRVEVDPGAADFLRTVPDEDTLMEVAVCMQPALGEALLRFALEPDNWADAVNQFAQQQEAPAAIPDVTQVLSDPANAGNWWLPPPGERALAAALKGELESWRVFLHPSQERLVRRQGSGALKVTGGPGTGKTVVALHRARFLAERVFRDDPRPVLVTTFSRTLTGQLEEMLLHLCMDAPELLDRFEVRSLTAVAQQLMRSADRPAQLVAGAEREECWNRALASEELGLPRHFYQAERDHVVERHGAWHRGAYAKAPRVGRHQRLSRVQKRQVWQVLQAFEEELRAAGGGDGAALCRDATALLEEGELNTPYSAVVCDEIQDVGASELRLLAALSKEDTGEIGANRLFLCGDGYQRLYRNPVPLSHCGIPIVGRSHRLKLNYRTTEGIRRAAVGVIEGLELDALEEDGPDGDPLRGYRSLRGGPLPEQHRFASPAEEAAWIAIELRDHPEELTLILARTKQWLEALRQLLAGHGHQIPILERTDPLDPAGPAALCTLHRAKGLEAPRVIVAGRQLIPHRWHGHGDATDQAIWERRERCLLYVGMTRARDWCGLSTIGAG